MFVRGMFGRVLRTRYAVLRTGDFRWGRGRIDENLQNRRGVDWMWMDCLCANPRFDPSVRSEEVVRWVAREDREKDGCIY